MKTDRVSAGRRRRLRAAVLLCGAAALLLVGGLWAYLGTYGLHVLLRHGGTYWVRVTPDDPRLSPAMRLAWQGPPAATPGPIAWHEAADGFELGELAVLVGGRDVDRIFLARIDPAKFRFEVRTAPAGDKGLDQWMSALGAALVINGSYYGRRGGAATPLLSNGVLLGPGDYDAKAGAFVSGERMTAIRDLAGVDWRTAFTGASDAMVSYPLLVAADGQSRVARPSRWLANRSFVGQDAAGRILLGTTADAFFSLDRLADFLRQAPLGLVLALNLDGGPVACQGISLNGVERRVRGRWELQASEDKGELLTWPYGTVPMPVVLAVFPKAADRR